MLVRFSPLTRFALVLLPVIVCAGRLHAQRSGMDSMTREINRCLTVVRVAASRRRERSAQENQQGDQAVAAGAAAPPAEQGLLHSPEESAAAADAGVSSREQAEPFVFDFGSTAVTFGSVSRARKLTEVGPATGAGSEFGAMTAQLAAAPGPTAGPHLAAGA